MNFFAVYFRISNHKFLWKASKGAMVDYDEQGGHVSLCDSLEKFIEFIKPKLDNCTYFGVLFLTTENCALSKELTKEIIYKLIPCEYITEYTQNYMDNEYLFRVKTNSEQLMEIIK